MKKFFNLLSLIVGATVGVGLIFGYDLMDFGYFMMGLPAFSRGRRRIKKGRQRAGLNRRLKSGSINFVPITNAVLVLDNISDREIIRLRMKNISNFICYLFTTPDGQEYIGSSLRGFDRVDEYLKLVKIKISKTPRAVLPDCGFDNVRLAIFEFKSLLEAKVFEQHCLDSYTCNMNINRKVNMKDINTGNNPVYVYDYITGTLTEYDRIGAAALATSVARLTVMRGIYNGVEVKKRYTFSSTPDITRVKPSAYNSGTAIFVYLNRKELVTGSFFSSRTNAAKTLGIAVKAIEKNIDKNTTIKGYSFHSKALTQKELKLISFLPVKYNNRNPKVWVYKDGTLIDGSPFIGFVSAGKAASVSNTSVQKHLDKITSPSSAPGYAFFSKPLSKEDLAATELTLLTGKNIPIWVYFKGNLVSGAPFSSLTKASEYLGVTRATIQRYLDTGKAIEGHLCYSAPCDTFE